MSDGARRRRFADDVDDALAAIWRGEPAAFPTLGDAHPDAPNDDAQQDDAGREDDGPDGEARDESTGGLEDALGRLSSEADAAGAAQALQPGDHVGDHVIECRIGRGGMGSVYAAHHQPTGRRVAIKVMRYAGSSEQELRWFQREMHALSRIQHPGIATLYEIGTTADDQPFLAMELVEGRPLNHALCGEPGPDGYRPAPPRTVATCLAEVARAVHAAHRRGVIHLDLKPSNIAVDADGHAKVLDFGLAHVDSAEHGLGEVAATSSTRPMAGTLPYMAPEQVRGDARSIDTCTDVYALGAILYELLTGHRPFDVDADRMDDAVHVIAHTDAIPPSSLVPDLDRDLDEVVGTAMAKDPNDRYASAAAFADDLERWLHRQPIEARAPTLLYRIDRFVRRQKVLTIAIAGSVLLLLAAWTATVDAMFRATAAQQLASERAARSEATLQLLTEMVGQAAPHRAGHDVTVREFLLEHSPSSIDRLAREGSQEPAVIASLHAAVGRSLQTLDLFDDAIPHLERALRLRRALDDPHALGTSLRDLGFCLHASEQLAAAEPMLREALAVRSAHLEPADPATLQSREELATLLVARGDVAEARTLMDANVAAARAVADRHPERLATELVELGEFLQNTSGSAEAIDVLEEACQTLEAIGAPPRERVRALRLLGTASLVRNTARDRAAAALGSALALAEAELEPEDLELADLHWQLARLASMRKDHEAALEHADRVVAIRRARLGEAAQQTLQARLRRIAWLANARGREAAHRELPTLHADTLHHLGREHSQSMVASARVAESYRTNGERERGQAVLTATEDLLDRDDLAPYGRYRLRVAQHAFATDGPPTDELRAAEALLAHAEQSFDPNSYHVFSSLKKAAAAASRAGQHDRAVTLAERAYALATHRPGAPDAFTTACRLTLYRLRAGAIEPTAPAVLDLLEQLDESDPVRAALAAAIEPR